MKYFHVLLWCLIYATAHATDACKSLPPEMSLSGPALTADQVEQANTPKTAVASTMPLVPFGHDNPKWLVLKGEAAPNDSFYWYVASSVGGNSNGYVLMSRGCFVGNITVIARKHHVSRNGT